MSAARQAAEAVAKDSSSGVPWCTARLTDASSDESALRRKMPAAGGRGEQRADAFGAERAKGRGQASCCGHHSVPQHRVPQQRAPQRLSCIGISRLLMIAVELAAVAL